MTVQMSGIRFSQSQIERAEKIVERIKFLDEAWKDKQSPLTVCRWHTVKLAVPSSTSGWYIVEVGGWVGSCRKLSCNCQAGQANMPCYHAKAALEWLKPRALKARQQAYETQGVFCKLVANGKLAIRQLVFANEKPDGDVPPEFWHTQLHTSYSLSDKQKGLDCSRPSTSGLTRRL